MLTRIRKYICEDYYIVNTSRMTLREQSEGESNDSKQQRYDQSFYMDHEGDHRTLESINVTFALTGTKGEVDTATCLEPSCVSKAATILSEGSFRRNLPEESERSLFFKFVDR